MVDHVMRAATTHAPRPPLLQAAAPRQLRMQTVRFTLWASAPLPCPHTAPLPAVEPACMCLFPCVHASLSLQCCTNGSSQHTAMVPTVGACGADGGCCLTCSPCMSGHTPSSSGVTPPGRSTTGGHRSPSSTVLSTPHAQGPPSTTAATRPTMSCSTRKSHACANPLSRLFALLSCGTNTPQQLHSTQ